MTQTTLSRLLESVFSDGYFTSDKNKNSNEEINNVLERLPFSLSKSQKTKKMNEQKYTHNSSLYELYHKGSKVYVDFAMG